MILKREILRGLITEEIQRNSLPKREIYVGSVPALVEVASTPLQRDMGLMFRKSLAENSGMIFVFPDCGHRGFWMKNTHIPLSIAFADDSGKILNIESMKPHDMLSKYSSGPARYALEMNDGWFERNQIQPGDFI